MKVQKHAIGLACLAALGFVGGAQAVQVAGDALEINTYFYPQYQSTSFGDTTTGPLSTLSAKTTAATNGNGSGKLPTTSINWVQSYLQFKGQKAFGDIRLGYNYEALVMSDTTQQTEQTAFGNARDVFVSASHNMLGTLQVGQMDTIYKEYGDRVRLLGVSSGNFVSTSGILSGVSWKPDFANVASSGNLNGVTSFNTRINGQLRWQSPNWNGVEVGISQRPDSTQSNTAPEQSLQAAGVRWSNPTYYAALSTEVHNNYRPFTSTNGGFTTNANTGAVSVTTPSVLANTATTKSKDTAVKLSFGYTNDKVRVGADVAQLKYTEDAAAASTGKFVDYTTTAWQVTGEYKLTANWTVGGGYAQGAAGTCTLSGGVACSTDGLGGSLVTMGARYDYDKSIGVFAIAGFNNNNSSAAFGSGANTGGNVTNVALGLLVRY